MVFTRKIGIVTIVKIKNGAKTTNEIVEILTSVMANGTTIVAAALVHAIVVAMIGTTNVIKAIATKESAALAFSGASKTQALIRVTFVA